MTCNHNKTLCKHVSSPPTPLLLLLLLLLLPRLEPNLAFLLHLKLSNLATVALVLVHPVLDQSADIVDEAVGPAIPDPQADDEDAAPEDEADGEIDPEEHGAVHHVKDFERDEEDEEQGDDGGYVGLRHEFVEQRGQVCGEGARDAEESGDDVEERVRKGRREEAREERGVVCWFAVSMAVVVVVVVIVIVVLGGVVAAQQTALCIHQTSLSPSYLVQTPSWAVCMCVCALRFAECRKCGLWVRRDDGRGGKTRYVLLLFIYFWREGQRRPRKKWSEMERSKSRAQPGLLEEGLQCFF